MTDTTRTDALLEKVARIAESRTRDIRTAPFTTAHGLERDLTRALADLDTIAGMMRGAAAVLPDAEAERPRQIVREAA